MQKGYTDLRYGNGTKKKIIYIVCAVLFFCSFLQSSVMQGSLSVSGSSSDSSQALADCNLLLPDTGCIRVTRGFFNDFIALQAETAFCAAGEKRKIRAICESLLAVLLMLIMLASFMGLHIMYDRVHSFCSYMIEFIHLSDGQKPAPVLSIS